MPLAEKKTVNPRESWALNFFLGVFGIQSCLLTRFLILVYLLPDPPFLFSARYSLFSYLRSLLSHLIPGCLITLSLITPLRSLFSSIPFVLK